MSDETILTITWVDDDVAGGIASAVELLLEDEKVTNA